VGGLLGPIGVVLCVPITMSLKFAFESSESTQWIAVLLGSEKSAESMPQMLKVLKVLKSKVLKKKIHSDT
jgi:AI-2 transport protein TqsA